MRCYVRQFLKFLLALSIAIIIVIVVRTFMFSVYSAPSSIGTMLKSGDKVMVNKLCRNQNFQKGTIIVFTENGEKPHYAIMEQPQVLGMIVAVPGNVIIVNKLRYRIPYKCCDRCKCHDCKLYLVDTGNGKRLVHKHQVVGCANLLFQ